MKKLAVVFVAGLVMLGGVACDPDTHPKPHSTRWTPPKSGTLQHGVHPTKTKAPKSTKGRKSFKAPKARRRG